MNAGRAGRQAVAAAVLALALAGCASGDPSPTANESPTASGAVAAPSSGTGPGTATEVTVTRDFTVTAHGTFDEGWALEFLPGTDFLLISERVGALKLRNQVTGEVRVVSGVPDVLHSGQAGMHDAIAGPTFEQDGTIYLSWVRPTVDGPQGVVGRGRLDSETATLEGLEVLWEQTPADGEGHFSLRLLIQGDVLFVTSGDRQAFTPAQEMDSNLGKIVRLTLDGEAAPGNPWEGDGDLAAQFWTIGHRNPLGIAATTDGNIWSTEMGPEGGDELNLIEAGENYGWPEASNGSHYGGADIPDHADGDGFRAPAAFFTPSISPGNLLIYRGDLFHGWQDSAIIGGLSGRTLLRFSLDGETATPEGQWDMGARIRAVEEAPDGSIWVLEDGAGGWLLELRPN